MTFKPLPELTFIHNPVIKGTLLLAIILFIPWPTTAETIHVAVASNFSSPMNDIAAEFKKDTGHKVAISFGSSGKFFAQISNGAPFQAFFSADQAKPKALEQSNLVVPGSRFTYATGSLALWSSDPTLIDADADVLKQGNFSKLAMANPKLAPYGAAALETLESMGLIEATQDKWVQGENISQAFQFIKTGNAQLGFVALSQIMYRGTIKTGSSWRVPANMYKPIRQDVVLLRYGENSEVTRAFLQYIRTNDRVAAIIQSYGYKLESALNPTRESSQVKKAN